MAVMVHHLRKIDKHPHLGNPLRRCLNPKVADKRLDLFQNWGNKQKNGLKSQKRVKICQIILIFRKSQQVSN